MMAALLRRSVEGGSYHVKLSLARSAMWIQELGFLDLDKQNAVPTKDNYPTKPLLAVAEAIQSRSPRTSRISFGGSA